MDYIYLGRNDYGEHPYSLHIQRGGLVSMFNMTEKDFAEFHLKMLEVAVAVDMRAEDIGLPASANVDDIPF